jgi:ribosome-associated protein
MRASCHAAASAVRTRYAWHMRNNRFIPNNQSVDAPADDFISRSAKKREADEVQRLAEGLIALKASEYAKLVLDDELKVALDMARKITSHIAHKRQMLFVAKCLRKRPDALPALYIAIDKPRSELKKQTAMMHRTEQWRDRLLRESDSALSEFIAQFPHVDRQALRALLRSAKLNREAVAAGKHDNGSYNALYRMLAQVLAEGRDGKPRALEPDDSALEDS